MNRLALTAADVREMLSSLLLAETPYDQRIQWAQGASLPADFVLDKALLPTLPATAQRADRMFHTSTADSIQGLTLAQWAEIIAGCWDLAAEAITFFTSGSTGEPVPATHAFAIHEQEVQALAELFRDRKRIVGFVPRHHIYGFLFSVLLPKALGIEVVWQQPMPTPGLVDQLCAGDLVIAFPLFWEKLVRLTVTIPQGVFGVTSTGPCRAEIIQALRNQGLERMTEMYGSSETGGIGYRHDPASPYTLLSHWQRSESEDILGRTMDSGEHATYKLQDALAWEDQHTFRPMGRTDKAVQVAGINVYPGRVRDMLLEHPKVKECAVRLMRPEEGPRLKALVVPEQGQDSAGLESELRAWAREKLTQYERPGSWAFSRRLPVNNMGKLSDWGSPPAISCSEK